MNNIYRKMNKKIIYRFILNYKRSFLTNDQVESNNRSFHLYNYVWPYIDAQVVLYGSTLFECAVKATSMIDIDVQFNDTLPYETLKELLSILRNCGRNWILSIYLYNSIFLLQVCVKKLIWISTMNYCTSMWLYQMPIYVYDWHRIILLLFNCLDLFKSTQNSINVFYHCFAFFEYFPKLALDLSMKTLHLLSLLDLSSRSTWWRYSSSDCFIPNGHLFSSTTRSTCSTMSTRIRMFTFHSLLSSYLLATNRYLVLINHQWHWSMNNMPSFFKYAMNMPIDGNQRIRPMLNCSFYNYFRILYEDFIQNDFVSR